MVGSEWQALHEALLGCIKNFRSMKDARAALGRPWEDPEPGFLNIVAINHRAAVLLQARVFEDHHSLEGSELQVSHPTVVKPATFARNAAWEVLPFAEADRQQAEQNLKAWLELVGKKAGRSQHGRSARASANRGNKLEARDQWVYEQCCKGRDMPYVQIVAKLKQIGPDLGWPIVESVQRIQQIGNEYAERHALRPPPPRQG